MRFLADENVSRRVVESLVRDGHEVIEINRTNCGADDPTVLGVANSSDQVLITEDRDFGELVVRQRLPVRAVLLIELDRLTNMAEAERVATVVASLQDKIFGHLVVVEPRRVRLRPLK